MSTKVGVVGIIATLCGALVVYSLFFSQSGHSNPKELTFIDVGTIHSSQAEPVVDYIPDTHQSEDSGLTEAENFNDWSGKVHRGDIAYTDDASSTKVATKTGNVKLIGEPNTQQKNDAALVTLDTLGISHDSGKKLTAAQGVDEETATKQKIHAFGNALGEKIQATVSANGDQNAALMQFVVSRNESAYATLQNIADNYYALSEQIGKIAPPDGFAPGTAKVAAGYSDVSKELLSFSGKKTDEIIYAQILTYNGAVEKFGESFISLAQLFGAYGVVFSPDEPGGIFSPAVSGF